MKRDKGLKSGKLKNADKEIAFLNQEKDSRATKLTDAYKEIAYQIEERGERAAELAIENIDLVYQNQENEKRTAELLIDNRELQKADAVVRKLNSELEKKVISRSAQYAFISQVGQTIVHVKDSKTLFRHVCRIALEFGKFKMAWIGSFDIPQKQITLLEHSGIPSEDIHLFTDISYEVNGPQDYVFRTGKHFVSNNIENTPELENWRPFATKHNIQSCIMLPIKKSGSTFGILSLYASELNFFKGVNLKVALEVNDDISFALDLFDRADRQKESELLILKNESRFRALIEKSSDMETLATREGKPFYASPSISKVLGYTPEDFINTSLNDLVHCDDCLGLIENLQNISKTAGSSFYTQLRLKHKIGHYIWCEATVTNMLDEHYVNAIVSNFRDISDQKSKEIQLEFERNNLDALINNTNDLLWSIDKNFNLITSNRPFDESGKVYFGKPITKGENVLLVPQPPEILSLFKRLYERALGGESFTEIIHIYLPVELWLQISYHPITHGDIIIGVACHSRNITGMKNTEEQLKKSESFNRGVLNSLISNIAVIDFSGELVAVNESWNTYAKQNGALKPQSTSVGSNYFSVCSQAAEAGDGIAQEVLVGMRSIMEEKNDDFYLEYPCDSPDEKRWYGMRAMKFDNDVPMIVVSHMNISERKLAEDNLVQSEARLKEAQALSHISNWDLDLITNICTWSDELYKICGINPREVNPSPEAFLSMLHPDDYALAKARIEKSFETFKAGSYYARIINKNDDTRNIYTEWKFEFDNNSKPIRFYGILQDITERTIAHEEREKLTNEMIRRNRDLEQFTFIISHNLRAPTANILGLAEILQDKTLTPQVQEELLKGLSTSATSLDTVINDINSILQVKHKVDEKKELLSFSKLVDDILNNERSFIEKYQARIKTDFSEVNEIFSLKVYLHSIFYNLINNSIKYSKPDEPPLIEIKSKKVSGKTILTFKDNGLGINMKKTGNNVFGLYKRFHFHIEGKGLGLFMVKTQVEAIGGKITLVSELNKGAEFTIVFEN